MTQAEILLLFDQYHNMVYRLALTMTHSKQDAEDITQTVFLKLLDGCTYSQAGKEKPWLTSVTINACKDLMRSAGILAAVLLICAFSVTAFAYGGRIIENVYQFMSGGTVEQGLDENGDAYTAGSIGTEDVISPVELRENGKLYLVVNSEEKDITDQFSYTEPYIYECTDEDGLRHAFVIGGELDAIGWSEFIWDENGMPTAGSSMFSTSGGRDDAPWLDIAMDELGPPW